LLGIEIKEIPEKLPIQKVILTKTKNVSSRICLLFSVESSKNIYRRV